MDHHPAEGPRKVAHPRRQLDLGPADNSLLQRKGDPAEGGRGEDNQDG